MLAGSGHSPIFLKALHHLHAKLCNQVGILPVNLFVTAPALVAPDVEDGSIDVGVAQQTGLLPGNAAYLADEFAVPAVPQTELGGEIGGLVCLDSAYAFVGEVHRDAQARLFYKELLHRVQGFRVGGCRPDVGILFGLKHSPGVDVRIQMLVYRAHAVLPYPVLPFRGGKVVLQHAPVAVEGDHLAGLFFQGHLPQEVLYAGIDGRGRVFVDVHAAVFVKVDPAFVVDLGGFDRLGGVLRFAQDDRRSQEDAGK